MRPTIPKGSFDVVTVQDPFVRGVFAWRIARRLGARLNVQVHADLAGQSFAKRMLARFVLSRADSVRVVSAAIRDQVRAFGVRVPVTILPIYIDIPAFSSVLPRDHAGKNVLWIGRFEVEKDPLAALDIFSRVLKKVPDARLKMLGTGSLEDAVSRRAATLPLQTVELTGWVNPITHLDTADALLSTSPYESFGTVFIEALAAGVPVISYDVGVAREAGASVGTTEDELVDKLVTTLREGKRGALNTAFHIPKDEWQRRFRESLA
jgi:glycosyltransferase involved in cell wall biosynthesis